MILEIIIIIIIIITSMGVCVFYYWRTCYKAVRVGGGGEWRTCAMGVSVGSYTDFGWCLTLKSVSDPSIYKSETNFRNQFFSNNLVLNWL